MAEHRVRMNDIYDAVARSPKPDNSCYHKAISEARTAFKDAETWLGGPVRLKTKAKRKGNRKFVVKWTFTLRD